MIASRVAPGSAQAFVDSGKYRNCPLVSTPRGIEGDPMMVQIVAEETRKAQFVDLPPEIHESIIRYCGINDIYSLSLVNHFLHNIVRSKLRDFLIAGCRNGIAPCATGLRV